MSKHRKVTPQAEPPPPDPSGDDKSSLADIEAGLREAFQIARDMVRSGDASVQVLREMGGLGRAITTVQAERRQQEKAREYTAKSIPIEVLLEALRLAPSETRAHVARELAMMDSTESVLG